MVREQVGLRPIVAKLVGGLGNQIFIYATAFEQARRLGVDVEVDTSWYGTQEKRFYGLEKLFSPSLHHEDSNQLKGFLGKVLRRLKKSDQVLEFREKSYRFHPEIYKILPGTTIKGYFQSTKYFPSVGSEIAKSIKNVIVPDNEQAIIDSISSSPFIAIHVRRGDYLSESHTREIHGLTTREYYEASLGMIGGREAPCIVFTDSPKEAKEELGDMSDLVFDSRIFSLGELATLKLMSLASVIVMSNSSFSWWAAYTMTVFDPDATVISPRPWSKEIYFNQELINSRWWSIGF
jgi:hypothetical protein